MAHWAMPPRISKRSRSIDPLAPPFEKSQCATCVIVLTLNPVTVDLHAQLVALAPTTLREFAQPTPLKRVGSFHSLGSRFRARVWLKLTI